MIHEPGHPIGPSVILQKEREMLKTISAALLAASVIVAPAIAATSGKTTQAPVTKSEASIKSTQVKKNPLNANAKMTHRRQHVRHSKHRGVHEKTAFVKTHKSPTVAAKHVMHPAKRG